MAKSSYWHFLRFGLLLVVLSGLAGCGGGAGTSANPVPPTVSSSNYSGPSPVTSDVQAFKINVWDNLQSTDRCGACHIAGVQSPAFVRSDDINLAYAEANSVVNLASPADSRMVTKVAGGHNCWLASDQACADTITNYIEAWAGNAAAGARTIQLKAPTLKDPGATKNLPAGPPAPGGFSPIHDLLTQHCSGCHVSTAAVPQAPFFADPNIDTSYEAAKSKIDVNNPQDSRLVVRLRDEFHNCWTSDCTSDAAVMQSAIETFAGTIVPDQVDPQLVISKALTIGDGIVASGGSRFESNLIALWEFKTGSGNTAYDTSGVEPALHLSLSGDVNWVGGWGVQINSGKLQGSTSASKKLHDLIAATGEYSIEAWIAPANVTQEDTRIVSYSGSKTTRNFMLGQTRYNYDFYNRTANSGANGDPAMSTADGDEDAQATLQHVVLTYDPVKGRRIYVNGVFTGDIDPDPTGALTNWDESFAFVLGNEVSNDRQWQGTIRLVAIHNRALTPEQIQHNFEVGVGEKFFLLFSVSHLVGLPDSYIMFEVSQFDSYSYLFNKPTFISLDPAVTPSGIPVRAMRIGINGKEAVVGQAYRHMDVTLDSSAYSPDTGQLLSDIGTAIALENGPGSDEFFLSFETIGTNTNVVTEPTVPVSGVALSSATLADIGLRTFDEINATMAELTGVDPQVTKSTFDTLRQALPAVETIQGFLSAHQMSIAQLAIDYCDALVENTGLRSGFFGSFGFNSDVATAFGTGDSAEKNQIIDALYDKMIGLPDITGNNGLTSAPTRAEVKNELSDPANGDGLFDKLTSSCPTGCDATRTRAIVKSMCASVLGSAAMLVQ